MFEQAPIDALYWATTTFKAEPCSSISLFCEDDPNGTRTRLCRGEMWFGGAADKKSEQETDRNSGQDEFTIAMVSMDKKLSSLPPSLLVLSALAIGSSTTLAGSFMYRRFLRRIPNGDWVTPDILARKQWVKGYVTRYVAYPLSTHVMLEEEVKLYTMTARSCTLLLFSSCPRSSSVWHSSSRE